MKKQNFKTRAQKTLRSEMLSVKKLSELTEGKDFSKAVKFLSSRSGKIIVTGVGKSGFIGMKIAATLTSLGQHAVFIHPVEAFHGDAGAVGENDVIIAISFSGGSAEVNRVVRYFKEAFPVKVIAITGNPSSLLASVSDAILKITVKEEGCPLGLAPMASTTTTMVVGDMLASAITSPDHFKPHNFAKFHPGGTLGLSLMSVEEIMTTKKGLPVTPTTSPFLTVLSIITEKNFGITGVTNKKGALVGIISDGDIRRFLMQKQKGMLEKTQAKQIMTKKPKTICVGATVKDALDIMEQNKITTLFVVGKDKEPVGILHMHSIIGNALF